MVDFNVNGKVAVVTGGSRGLGLDIAEAFVENGASTVVITSRKVDACEQSKKHLEQLASKLNKRCKIISAPADLTSDEQCVEFYRTVSRQVDKVDILVANAGASWGAPLDEHPVAAVRKVLDLNVTSVFHTIQLFHGLLAKAGTAEDPARVIITSSVASLISQDFAGTYGYLASKAGVSHMGKNLATQLGPENITVNSIAPGFFPTKMSAGILSVAGDVMTESNPRKRLGNKEDIKAAVLFLCDKHSNYINGIVLPIDGGAHLSGTFTAKL